ncbi:TetR/AcrR family transcriptional regulator [Sporosarcina sp. Sa2YVA2]|uniref:TetR/AcrR family transcriptional regulator n=1 Tax=Sporosarcina quadrami TaxID=2762234 RepID=A0ABR8UF83_9BACL|nr:TetR/AcrR family transcriptional regulator [Sporosarcina quadrami]MBD7986279.1 TetR/AcrR family transcriptional regulator [Sporosarcina quadrami]
MSIKVDPRIIRTKAMFEEALLELMQEKDFKKISVREISERSKLNRATFYLHYYDKDELLEQLLDEALVSLKESVKVIRMEYDYDCDKAHPIFVRLFEKIQERSRFYEIMLVHEKVPYFTEAVMGIIQALVEDGSQYMVEDSIKFIVPKEISNAYIATAYLGVIIWWLKNGMPHSPTYMSKQLTRMSTVGPFEVNPYLK